MTLKSLNFSLLVLTIENDDLSLLAERLNKKRLMAPGFFQYAPIVVDVKKANGNLDFLQIKTIVAKHEFILAGVSGELSNAQKEKLQSDNIAILRSAKKQLTKTASIADGPAEAKIKPSVQQTIDVVTHKVKTEIYTGRVRSGQRIHAHGSDLVINGDVSPGAEVIADGNIHIYGSLRGRALAGAKGDQSAAIFCRLLASELVSISGEYKLVDALPSEYFGKSSIITLRNEQLNFDSLN